MDNPEKLATYGTQHKPKKKKTKKTTQHNMCWTFRINNHEFVSLSLNTLQNHFSK
jgi:hypothetical protein